MKITYRCKCGNKLEVDQVKPVSYGYDAEVILEQCDMCVAKHSTQSDRDAPRCEGCGGVLIMFSKYCHVCGRPRRSRKPLMK